MTLICAFICALYVLYIADLKSVVAFAIQATPSYLQLEHLLRWGPLISGLSVLSLSAQQLLATQSTMRLGTTLVGLLLLAKCSVSA